MIIDEKAILIIGYTQLCIFPDKVSISFILIHFQVEFQAFGANYNMQSMEKTISEVHSLLIEFEKVIKRNKQQIVGAFSTPHVMAIQSDELMKKKKTRGQNVASTSLGIYTIELFAFPKNSWVYDTGCGTHICNTKQGLRGAKKLKRGSLYFNKRTKPNLDSSYLWHCRLAHINKKPLIDKLQHDGHIKTYDNEPLINAYPVYLTWSKNCAKLLHTFTGAYRAYMVMIIYLSINMNLYYTFKDTKETMGYYFYYPPENKIVVERYADFLEKDFILQKESGRNVELDDEDILPSENTSEHPFEEESLAPIVSQEEDVVPVCRSVMTHKALIELCLNVEIDPIDCP
ncbi:hypothetical protein Tco_0465280 [Tanacetum coccineum]